MDIWKRYKICKTEDQSDHILGEGAFAKVYKAVDTQTGAYVAIKRIDKELLNKDMLARVENEIAIHREISRAGHPCILKMHAHCNHDRYIDIYLDLCYISLEDYRNKNRLSEQEVRQFCLSITKGLIFLHSHGILHRDIKPANLLLTKNKEIKIADFGLANWINEGNNTICGTLNYMPPEVKARGIQTFEMDNWSFGCVLYTLLVGDPLPENENISRARRDATKKKVSRLSSEAQDLLDSLLMKKPQDRISLEDVLKHPFMKKSFQPSADSGVGSMTQSRERGSNRGSYRTRSADYDHPRRDPEGLPTFRSVDHGGGRDNTHSADKIMHFRPRIGRSERKTNMNEGAGFKALKCNLQTLPSHSLGFDRNVSPVRTSKVLEEHGDSGHCHTSSPCSQDLNNRCSRTSECQSTSCHCSTDRQCSCSKSYHSEHCSAHHVPVTCNNQNSCPTSPSHSTHSNRGGCSNGCNLPMKHSACSHYGSCNTMLCSHGEVCCCKNSNNVGQRDAHNYAEADTHVHRNNSQKETGLKSVPPTKASKDLMPPLDTSRLPVIRQKCGSAVMSITNDGSVYVEFIKTHKNREIVVDVCIVYKGGKRGVIYRPGPKGTRLSDSPPEFRDMYKHEWFDYENLSPNQWKKYDYAARFVKVIQRQKAKLIFYSALAKNVLMESLADFEMQLYDGGKIVKSENTTKFVSGLGRTSYIKDMGDVQNLNLETIWDHFLMVEQKCHELEQSIADLEEKTGLPLFPAFFGSRPTPVISALRDSNKENISSNLFGEKPPTFSNFPSYSGTIGSVQSSISARGLRSSSKENSKTGPQYSVDSIKSRGQKRRTLKEVSFPKGTATEFTDGEVHIKLYDGTFIDLNSADKLIMYRKDENGQKKIIYDKRKDSTVPLFVQEKLKVIPDVGDRLSKARYRLSVEH